MRWAASTEGICKMKIYTKTGDKGETGLVGGLRVSKADRRLEAYGEVDELNSCLGLLVSELENSKARSEIEAVEKVAARSFHSWIQPR